MSNNFLSGNLPSSLSLLTHLTLLRTCNNSGLVGTIPTALASIPTLVSLLVTLGQCGTPLSECVAGYVCTNSSLSLRGTLCIAGKYSLGGEASACLQCPSGRYGSTPAMPDANCTGLCAAGYKCTQGSVTPTALPCPVGAFSVEGAGVCTACPGGRFTSVAATSSPLCQGACPAGFMCPSGLEVTLAIACAAGTYSLIGATACSPCPPGAMVICRHRCA